MALGTPREVLRPRLDRLEEPQVGIGFISFSLLIWSQLLSMRVGAMWMRRFVRPHSAMAPLPRHASLALSLIHI